MNRTSLTHPLQIATIPAGPGLGQVGLTFCPGKRDRHAMTGAWERDLDLDLDAVQAWGAAAVVTLVTKEELVLLGVSSLGQAIEARGMTWFHLPIVDVSVPDAAFEGQWHTAAAVLHASLRRGRHVLVHCRGGLGRAGTIAARLLVELGWPPASAIVQVRAVRPGAIETREQERYVLRLQTAGRKG